MIQPILPGNPVRAIVTFKNEDGETADPTIVTCRIVKPNEERESPRPTRISQGKWEVLLRPRVPGTWEGYFFGTGALEASARFVFPVANVNV
jgi:hypothetical protein